MKYQAVIGAQKLEVETSGNAFLVDGKERAVDVAVLPSGVYSLIVDGRSYEVLVRDEKKGMAIEIVAHLFLVRLEDPSQRRNEAASPQHEGEAVIESPMPGRVVAIKVQAGQNVREGEGIIVVEAMKMENELTAPKAGKVVKVSVKVGDAVEAGQELVVIE